MNHEGEAFGTRAEILSWRDYGLLWEIRRYFSKEMIFQWEEAACKGPAPLVLRA